jgi:hypothetical protein
LATCPAETSFAITGHPFDFTDNQVTIWLSPQQPARRRPVITCRIFALVMVLSTIIKRTFSALVPTKSSLGDCKDIKCLLTPAANSARNRPYAAPVLRHKKHFGWDRMNTLERKAGSLISHTRNDRRLHSTPPYKWRIPIV